MLAVSLAGQLEMGVDTWFEHSVSIRLTCIARAFTRAIELVFLGAPGLRERPLGATLALGMEVDMTSERVRSGLGDGRERLKEAEEVNALFCESTITQG